MIFVIFFGLIAIVFIGLNILDNSNIDKIESYFKSQQCQTISYVSGTYRGACSDKIIVIKNGFSVDVFTPEKLIYYNDIKKITKKEKQLVILTKSEDVLLDFKEQVDLDKFFNEVQNRL